MSKERLIIKNFGPIKSVDLELGKMTILIGDNATGKSTIAKVLAVCRYFSYIVNCEFELGYDSSFDDGLSYWGISEYLNENSYIEYHSSEYKIHVTYEIKDWEYDQNENGEVIGEPYPTYAGAKVYFDWKSEKFEDLIRKLEEIQPWKKNKENPFNIDSDWFNWKPNSNFFEIEVKKVMENPFYFPTERGLQSVFSLGRSRSVNDSLYEQLADLYNIATYYSKPTSIEPFSIKYQNIDGRGFVQKESEEKLYSLQNSASGYQSTIPLILVIKYYAEREKRYNRTYIIEEPETNLFPSRQKKLMEFLVETINQYRNQYIIPTHSPYLLSSLNNLLYAYKVANSTGAKSEVNKIINEKYWLKPADVEVYYLENGKAKTLINKEDGLINIDDLDSVSEIINEEFDKLIAIEIQHSKEVEDGLQ